MNKRGISWTPVLWVGGVILFFILSYMLVQSSVWSWATIDTNTEGFENILSPPFKWMNYIFGGIPVWLKDRAGPTSAVIITIAIFVLVFVTFGDIIEAFSTFSPPVAWISAAAIAIIAANLKGIVVVMGFFIGIFAFLGGLAVLVGLGAAFLAFVVVNLGIGRFGPWIMKRRAFMVAEKLAIKAEAGGKELGGTIKGLKEMGKALEGA